MNNQTTTIDYTNHLLSAIDPFGRSGSIIGPAITINGTTQHQHTTTKYFDYTRQVVISTDLNAENDQLLKSRTTSDMLGRVVLSELSEDGNTYTIAVHKAYDTANRVTFTSNPMRTGVTAASDGWTRITNDVAGRVTEVATFGGVNQPPAVCSPSPADCSNITGHTGKVTTAYDANFTTVTDQASRKRRSKVDGLGRLVRVDEPGDPYNNDSLGSTSSPAQPTSYAYDVLGNLVQVTQGSQYRYFMYDSLARLRRASNPEQSANTSLNLSDPITGNSQWAIGYVYDDNGNLTQKTDARGVTSAYVYDALNRAISRSYSDGTPTVTYTYDYASGVSNPKGRLISVSSSVSTYSYSGYDNMGRATGGTQTIGSQSYLLSYAHDLSGHVKSMTYPSGRTVTNSYDTIGRLSAVSGNLGDGTTRTYSTGIIYDAASRLKKEQFGTDTPVYNKLWYNSRGQLAEIRDSTSYTDANDTSWNRGAIINHYSNNCWGMCAGQSMTDNNGNLLKQEHEIPDNDQVSTAQVNLQFYGYDSLNRLQSFSEGHYVWGSGSPTSTLAQGFVYDRWGNRTIDYNGTTSTLNRKQFSVNTSNNRLGVPSGQTGTMTYDSAGNLTVDTYSAAAVSRTYDAENRMTAETQASSYVAGSYKYDGDGRRVKRIVNGTKTWQVYGLGGELLAEYAANTLAASPQKEYGYRNGQLLITADAPTTQTGQTQNVEWTNSVGVTVSGNSLSKTAATVWGNFRGGFHADADRGRWLCGDDGR